MSLRRLLKLLHITGTLWMALCAAFLLVLALRQAGVGWWIVFSLSGFSGVAFFFLLSIYLFAIFRGVMRKQMAREHPLTTSPAYILFYDLCPFLGALAGLASLGLLSVLSSFETLSITAEGTLAMTFVVWILSDPLISVAEGILPSSTVSRRERLALENQARRQREEERYRLLEQIRSFDQTAKEQWNHLLLPLAGELSEHLTDGLPPRDEIRQKAIEFGARAWQLGGVACMQHLLRLVNQRLLEKKQEPNLYLAFLWDGIGKWRRPVLKEAFSAGRTGSF
jgi:hypothetical protein